MKINKDEVESKALRRAILKAKENNDIDAISQAEKKLQSLAESSDDVETHFHLAMIAPTIWSKTLKTEDIPEKLLLLFQQHPNTVARLLFEDDLEEGKLARSYLEVIYNNNAYRPYIDDTELLSKIRRRLQKRVGL